MTPEQMTFDDLRTAPREAITARADAGMAQALRADRAQPWTTRADAWLDGLERGAEVFADDLVLAIGLPDHGVAKNNAVGAWFRAQGAAGRLVFTGRMRKSEREIGHGNLLRVWRVA
jgi:hypothetical protein